MIFVTVGNATQEFYRLLSGVEDLCSQGFFGDEEVLLQSGNTNRFKAQYCTEKKHLSVEDYAKAMATARIIICHAGAGSLYHAFQAGRVPVVMPRRRKYGEHVEDQFVLVQALERQGKIIAAYEVSDLPAAIGRAAIQPYGLAKSRPDLMLELVGRVITRCVTAS